MNAVQEKSLNQYLCRWAGEKDKDFWLEGVRNFPDLPDYFFEQALLVYLQAKWHDLVKWN